MVKRDQETTYVFAVGMRNHPATATFRCKHTTATRAEVISENRTIELTDDVFADEFAPYTVHLYRLR
jgi:hypothetical protein